MILAGAGGHCIEVLDVFQTLGRQSLIIYEEKPFNVRDNLFGFPITANIEEAIKSADSTFFCLALGGVYERKKMFDIFSAVQLYPYTIISPDASIGTYQCQIEEGASIMKGVMVSSGVIIRKGSLINSKSEIHHGSIIGEFCEIAPSVKILGNVDIGSFSFIGAGTIVLPGIKVGKNVKIGAASLVTKNVPDGFVGYGIPLKRHE